jgi:peptide-N4-(N-acetyl-beta-glucosaminyl)asparagine amidase
LFKINKFSRNTFGFPYTKESFILYKNVARQYKDKEVLAYVNHLIPSKIKEEIIITISRENNNDIEFLKPILDWFKKDYMKWMSSNSSRSNKKIKCQNCNIPLHFRINKGNSWKLRMTEIYECLNCNSSKIVFPRYGEIKRIADSRIGRCSEWSMLFGALLNSLSIETRIVQDYLDHCWNEALIDDKWIHIDSTLEYPISLNHPHYYEKNWAKKYKYILAFSYNYVDDVTSSYTDEWQNVQERRKKDNKKKENIMESFKNFYTEI